MMNTAIYLFMNVRRESRPWHHLNMPKIPHILGIRFFFEHSLPHFRLIVKVEFSGVVHILEDFKRESFVLNQ